MKPGVVAALALAVAVVLGAGVGYVVVNRSDPGPGVASPTPAGSASSSAVPTGTASTGIAEPSTTGLPTLGLPTEQPTGTGGPTASSTPAPPPADYPATFDRVRSGTVRIFASTCSGTGIGTGFLIDSRTVLTALPTVARAVSVVAVVGRTPGAGGGAVGEPAGRLRGAAADQSGAGVSVPRHTDRGPGRRDRRRHRTRCGASSPDAADRGRGVHECEDLGQPGQPQWADRPERSGRSWAERCAPGQRAGPGDGHDRRPGGRAPAQGDPEFGVVHPGRRRHPRRRVVRQAAGSADSHDDPRGGAGRRQDHPAPLLRRHQHRRLRRGVRRRRARCSPRVAQRDREGLPVDVRLQHPDPGRPGPERLGDLRLDLRRRASWPRSASYTCARWSRVFIFNESGGRDPDQPGREPRPALSAC